MWPAIWPDATGAGPNRDSFEDLANRAKTGLIPRSEFERELRNLPQVATIHIVPKPELKVTGAPGTIFGLNGLRGLDDNTLSLLGPQALEALKYFRFPVKPGDKVHSPLVMTACPKCKHELLRSPDWACCPYCGAKLPPQKPKADGG